MADHPLQNALDSGYSSPNAMNLTVDMEKGVTYDNCYSQVMFHMENNHFSHRRRHVLQDTSNKPICVLHKKKATLHGRWEGRNGDGDKSELRFIVKRPSKIALGERIVLDVFLPTNTEETVFKVKANVRTKSCEIFAAQSTVASANMESKDAMEVRVEGNVDRAFVVALIMIVDHKMINQLEKISNGMLKVASEVLATASVILNIIEMASDLKEDYEGYRSQCREDDSDQTEEDYSDRR